MRFTYKMLKQELVEINAKLEVGRSYKAATRNGYTAVDEFGPNSTGRVVCIRCVATGTPRECYNALLRQLSD